MRIAALDDDPAQLEAVERALTGAGHSCQTFPLAKVLGLPLLGDPSAMLVHGGVQGDV